MNELESLLQLNKMLLAESPQYLAQAAAFPPDAEAQWRLFRSLVNVRAPRPAGGDFLALQDKFTKLTLSKSYFMTDAIVLALSLTYIPAGRIVFSFITVTLSSFLIERIQRIGAPCAAAEQGA